ncbi:MAG: fatty acyl-AMP ligase [Pseudomonadota bacterium]|nr:fatty acyl-AMP ligase [Pseudomonadota bacterium]
MHYARIQGDKQFLLWLERGRIEAYACTFAELDASARSLAVMLVAAVERRSRAMHGDLDPPAALIVTRPGPEFVLGFFACLYAGIAAVPVHAPRKNESGDRLVNIIEDCRAAIVITDPSTHALLQDKAGVAARVELLDVSAVDQDGADRWIRPDVTAGSTAFIQYTSGSTGLPKGVVISHQNLMSNERMIAEAMDHGRDTVCVSWLPVFHDMGLIGNLLQAFYLGGRCILMAPQAFVANPIRWLEAISRYRATMSGAPNFAYDLCVLRTTQAQRSELDLSCWKIAFNGAEPVRKGTLDRFAAAYSAHGFRSDSFFPCYGMAESTLFVTGSRQPTTLAVDKALLHLDMVAVADSRFDDEAGIVHLVSSGVPPRGCRVEIVDSHACAILGDDHVGEIWVDSPSVSLSYMNQPDLSREVLHAHTCDGTPGARFLRTGDLGFTHAGKLFVTGRSKDLIIISGRNHYPHDIELTAWSALAEAGINLALTFSVAAFPIDVRDEERLVILLSVHRNTGKAFVIGEADKIVRTAVVRQHGVAPYDIAAVGGRLPVTSSGKLQRNKCRQMYLGGDPGIISSLPKPKGDSEPSGRRLLAVRPE